MPREYKNIIFTNHAQERLKDRSIDYSYIAQVVNSPDKKFHAKGESWKFIKTINHRKLHVVATYQRDQKKWLVISVWVRGEDDKVPIIWQLLTLPFKLILWLIKMLFRLK